MTNIEEVQKSFYDWDGEITTEMKTFRDNNIGYERISPAFFAGYMAAKAKYNSGECQENGGLDQVAI